MYSKAGDEAPITLTALNKDVLAGKPIAEAEPFTFLRNDHRFEVEAFLTTPSD